MTWSNPPATTVQLRTQLLACAAISTLGIDASRCHYPDAALAVDTLPLLTITDTQNTRTRYAEGAIPLPNGAFVVVIYVDNTTYDNAGQMEALARQVILELGEQYYGLPIKSMDATVASSPTPGGRAADEVYRTITLNIQYGLGS